MLIRDRIKEFRRVPANQLLPNPMNWRTHPKEQLDAIRGILAEVGFAGAQLARELPDGSLQLIDGHARAEVAGDADVPVLILDVTEDEAKKILATFDPVGAMAGKDAEKLAALITDLKEQEDILAGLVWPDYVIDPLLAADWTPPEKEDLPSSEPDSQKKGSTLSFSKEQMEVIIAAAKKFRDFNEDDSISTSQCVEIICNEYLLK